MVYGLWGVRVIQGMLSSYAHILGTVCVLQLYFNPRRVLLRELHCGLYTKIVWRALLNIGFWLL